MFALRREGTLPDGRGRQNSLLATGADRGHFLRDAGRMLQEHARPAMVPNRAARGCFAPLLAACNQSAPPPVAAAREAPAMAAAPRLRLPTKPSTLANCYDRSTSSPAVRCAPGADVPEASSERVRVDPERSFAGYIVDRSLQPEREKGDALRADPRRATPLLPLCATLPLSTTACAGSRPTE